MRVIIGLKLKRHEQVLSSFPFTGHWKSVDVLTLCSTVEKRHERHMSKWILFSLLGIPSVGCRSYPSHYKSRLSHKKTSNLEQRVGYFLKLCLKINLSKLNSKSLPYALNVPWVCRGPFVFCFISEFIICIDRQPYWCIYTPTEATALDYWL